MITGSPSPRRSEPFHFFLPALTLLLGGYLFFGRAFAYISVPGTPIFLGEIVLAIGVLEALRVPLAMRLVVRRSRVLAVLALFMAACGIRLVADLGGYGLDAIRDSAIWYYGAFALIVAAACESNPTFLPRLVRSYTRALPIFLAWSPIAVIVGRMDLDRLVPGSDTPINAFKPGDIAVNVSIGMAFLWVGAARTRTMSAWAIPLGLVGLLAAGSQNRGGFLAGLVVLALVVKLVPDKRRVLSTAAGWTAALAIVLLIVDPRIDVGRREISLDQIRSNISSVIGVGGGAEADTRTQNLQDTTSWRLAYWGEVVDDALSPRFLLVGQGFGPVLADRYGFQAGGASADQELRNAHNSHVTLLARAGLPLALVWLLLWITFVRTVRPSGWRSSSVVDGLLRSWVVAAVTGILINAIFDPVIEGPQVGIWLWVLVGIGAHLARAATTADHRLGEPRRSSMTSA